jgi:hypothetical protein
VLRVFSAASGTLKTLWVPAGVPRAASP